jgi:Xaa-Pro aminopeptidase
VEGTCGVHIDAFARSALWKDGLDYEHGTGHGVGSFLNVHEGPEGISKQARVYTAGIQPGMVLSNEPGIYYIQKSLIGFCNITPCLF